MRSGERPPQTRPRPASHYLQVRDGGFWVQGVLPQQPLFVQELPRPAIEGRLEEAIIQDVLQAVVQGAKDALLGGPDGDIRVQAQTLLWRGEGKGGRASDAVQAGGAQERGAQSPGGLFGPRTIH